ncbi:type III-B CRISPR module RAMP protein Cmr6 [Acinetobacter guillouiae]|uniref:type III-B CRISPR module RAMP protein Cmr6 n=1 Tax=Acinetobacter guillouiae TaxID=106649 RepID=UPI003AF57187
MIRLIRDSLAPLVPKALDGHAGLLMQRGLQVWEESDKKDRQDLLEIIGSIQASELYLLAFNRWLTHTYSDSENNPNYASVVAKIDGRLFTGLSIGGTLETGVITHHSYGMPMLAGSAVKGAVRAYAESIFLLKDAEGKVQIDAKGKTQINPVMKDILNILFGTDEDADQQNAGYLIWHDAWWVPPITKDGKLATNDQAKPFVGEIVTVHHQKYYSDKMGHVEPLDMESPIPNQQIAIQGDFYFTIEGEPQWVKFAKDLLENMLQQMGMGAKGTSGYGYFKLDEQLTKNTKERYQRLSISVDLNDPLQPIRRELQFLSESDLIENLSKNLNKLFEKLGFDKDNEEHCQQIAQVVFDCHHELISEWANVKNQKNKERAWKFLTKYKTV